MLVDPQFRSPSGATGLAIALIFGDGPLIPERISKGAYLAGHWNVRDLVTGGTRERWREDDTEWLNIIEYGVCDSPEQAMAYLNLEDRPEPFFVSFVKIRKADQPHSGGWRWHKWGEYIGDHDPRHEYLHDEPDIDEVYTFTVHEMPAEMAAT